MFYVLSKILDLAFSPLAWALFLGAYALPWGRPRRGQRASAAASIVVLYTFSNEVVANALAAGLERGVTSTMKADVVYDAVVLLGGVVDDRASMTSGRSEYNEDVERLLATYDVLRSHGAKVAIISGGAVDKTRMGAVEARVLGKQLVDWGIAEDRVIVEDEAKNTHENAVFVGRIVREKGWSRLLMVTSAFHVPRARDCFRKEGLAADVLPVDYRSYDASRFASSWLPRPTFLALSTQTIRELAGRVIYRVQGYGKGE